jgi:hypothetical protein
MGSPKAQILGGKAAVVANALKTTRSTLILSAIVAAAQAALGELVSICPFVVVSA